VSLALSVDGVLNVMVGSNWLPVATGSHALPFLVWLAAGSRTSVGLMWSTNMGTATWSTGFYSWLIVTEYKR
jgi:hypothetical protein